MAARLGTLAALGLLVALLPALAPPAAAQTNPFAGLCFIDDVGTGNFHHEDPLYVSTTGCGTTASKDLRLKPVGAQAAMTQVRSGHTDLNKPTLAVGTAASVDYLDADGSGGYNTGDFVYLDMDGDGRAEVADVRLSTTPYGGPGSSVRGTDTDHNSALAIGSQNKPALTGFGPSGWTSWGFEDKDGDATYSLGDVVFIDGDNDGTVDATDLRLQNGIAGDTGNPPPPPGEITEPTVTIAVPADAAFLKTGDAVALSGAATAGTDASGVASTVQSVTLKADGVDVTVTGTTTWTASWTPAADGTHTLVATVTNAASRTGTDTNTVTSNVDGAATHECPDGSTIPASERCPGFDEQARDDAAAAQHAAEEAQDAAEAAQEAAEEARDAAEAAQAAAEGAADAAEDTSAKVDDLAELLADQGPDESEGVPAPGVLFVLAAVLLVAVLRGREP